MERLEIKKLRNREAAQRARDRAKLYTVELENEVEALRSEVVLLRSRQFVCVKCGGGGGGGGCEMNLEGEVREEVGEYFFEEEKIEELEPMFDLERVKNNHGFSFPMFLMVITVILCLVVPFNPEPEPATTSFQHRPHRLLQEIVNISQ